MQNEPRRRAHAERAKVVRQLFAGLRSWRREGSVRTGEVGVWTRQLECMRAFQSGRSWYEAYWYPEPQPQHPGIASRALSTLVLLLERCATPRRAARIGADRLPQLRSVIEKL